MKFQVIGVMPSQGEFKPSGAENSIRYNNVNLFVVDLDSPCTVGHQTSKIKLKAEKFNQLFPQGMNSIVNEIIDIYYNQWGTPDKVQILKKN